MSESGKIMRRLGREVRREAWEAGTAGKFRREVRSWVRLRIVVQGYKVSAAGLGGMARMASHQSCNGNIQSGRKYETMRYL